MNLRNVCSALTLLVLSLLGGCGDVTPGSPEMQQEEWTRQVRLAARGDSDALRLIIQDNTVQEDSQKMLKWADRLSWYGKPEGFDLSASARAEIAKKMPLDDPERLLLLVEAREFGLKAASADPEHYNRMSKESDWLGNDIRSSETALEKKFGKIR
jgi:hypothetical protein